MTGKLSKGDGSHPGDDPFALFKNERSFVAQSGCMKTTITAMDWAVAEIERLRAAKPDLQTVDASKLITNPPPKVHAFRPVPDAKPERERVIARPAAFLAWAVTMFGPVAKLRSERLLRFVEEAIELAHAEGMERNILNLIADRVYSRAAGNVGKEIGQTQACLETFAENIGLSSDDEAEREWIRVREIPQEEWARRHAAKQAIGIALKGDPA